MLLSAEVVSSLEKVLCRPEKSWRDFGELSGLRGERLSFQVAVKSKDAEYVNCRPADGFPYPDWLRIRLVESVPCYHPGINGDDDLLATVPSLLPDPLMELDEHSRISRQNWHAFFINVTIPRDAPVGELEIPLQVDAHGYFGEKSSLSVSKTIRIFETVMPDRQDANIINWFYADCIMAQHNVECWSEEHWALLEKYAKNYAEHGSTLILTPLWTVSLDIAPGKQRPKCQLLDITEVDGKYEFKLDRLERWIHMIRKVGIRGLEISHVYTQWGAKHCPGIFVKDKDGVETMRFGWECSAVSPEYTDFLRQLFAVLIPFLRQHGFDSTNCYFHVSDEPTLDHLESYSAAVHALRPLLDGFPMIDALSHFEFYERGLVTHPVPDFQHLKPFFEVDLEERWWYYAGSGKNMPGRYIGQPSRRNRVIGILMAFLGLDGGFLHWGYNNHSTFHSTRFDIDPYKETDWGRSGCSGCGFLVYPGPDGPVDSIRNEVFFEAIQDYRALKALEAKIGRQGMIDVIVSSLPADAAPLAVNAVPKSNSWLLSLRNAVNAALG